LKNGQSGASLSSNPKANSAKKKFFGYIAKKKNRSLKKQTVLILNPKS